ncbi:MAG: transposase [Acidobacteria bacterium]|nr:transposase [Acidobacteriota bacterium]
MGAVPCHGSTGSAFACLPTLIRKPNAWYFITVCCRGKEALLRARVTRNLIQETLRQTAVRNHVELAAYSILPDHLHVICSAGEKGLVSFIREFKSRAALELLRRSQPSPWQRSFFDHKVRSDESLRQKCEYVWMNPVRRGLARSPEDYPWNGSLLTG